MFKSSASLMEHEPCQRFSFEASMASSSAITSAITFFPCSERWSSSYLRLTQLMAIRSPVALGSPPRAMRRPTSAQPSAVPQSLYYEYNDRNIRRTGVCFALSIVTECYDLIFDRRISAGVPGVPVARLGCWIRHHLKESKVFLLVSLSVGDLRQNFEAFGHCSYRRPLM